MSKEQTFRSEDNTFLPLIKRQLSVRCVTTLSSGGGEPSATKDLKLNTPVSSLLQVRPLLNFYCRIRAQG